MHKKSAFLLFILLGLFVSSRWVKLSKLSLNQTMLVISLYPSWCHMKFLRDILNYKFEKRIQWYSHKGNVSHDNLWKQVITFPMPPCSGISKSSSCSSSFTFTRNCSAVWFLNMITGDIVMMSWPGNVSLYVNESQKLSRWVPACSQS